MVEFVHAKVGSICLIQEKEDGRISQIGLTPEQSELLQIFLSSLSKESPLVMMSEEYDLVLSRELCNKCKG